MSCTTCGSAGSCGCSSVTIPTGQDGADGANGVSPEVVAEAAGANCVYGGVKITDAAGNITYVCNGAPGSNGAAGTMAKYANTFIAPPLTFPVPITIPLAAITSCNSLTPTCASTPQNFDFNISVWYQSASSQWVLVTNNSSYVDSITYDTTGSVLTILPAVAFGQWRVIIIG